MIPRTTSPTTTGSATTGRMLTAVIRPGQPEDLTGIGQVLARAFDEPVTRWLVPDPERHPVVMPQFFAELAADALADGLVDVVCDAASGSLLGAAVWFDMTAGHPSPGIDISDIGTDTSIGSGVGAGRSVNGGEPDAGGDWKPSRWARILGPDAARWGLLDALMGRHHYPGPHWYLLALGVRPDVQRRGLGGQLLTHRHGYLDDDPAYLEATTLDSLRLYARHGYADLGELPIPGGPSLWRMLRPSTSDLLDLTHTENDTASSPDTRTDTRTGMGGAALS